MTIYSKFGSKQELFSAIVDDICEQILAMEIILPGAVESSYETGAGSRWLSAAE